MTYKPDHYQELALKTWYSPDDPRYLDPRHPLIKLAGEAGEVLDLFGKHEYKPGFSWWDCKCGHTRSCHTVYQVTDSPVRAVCMPGQVECSCSSYCPKVLDELGDYWYYLRIVAYQKGVTFEDLAKGYSEYDVYYLKCNLLSNIADLSFNSSGLLVEYVGDGNFELGHLQYCAWYFLTVLKQLDCTIDHLTELNYAKLNSEPTAHGWKR